VFIDGRNMGKTPLQLKNFTPGEHVLRIAKEGYIDAETTVALVPNETRNIKLVLEELPETREKRLRMQSAQDHYEAAMEEYRAIAKPKQIAGWTLLGTGLGAAGAAAALYAVGWVNAEDNYSKYSKTVNQDKMNRYWGNVQDGETLITVGHVMTAATVVLIGTSIYFFATIPKKPVEPKVVKYIPVPSIVNGMPYIGWGTEF
jgi:hypothetical protein